MYGLPPGTKLDFLKGATLLQACFGENDLILNFSDNISVAIFSSIGVGLQEEGINRYVSFAEASAGVLKSINRDVVNVEWAIEGTVTILFENRCIIQLYDDSAEFESFTITSPEGRLIV